MEYKWPQKFKERFEIDPSCSDMAGSPDSVIEFISSTVLPEIEERVKGEIEEKVAKLKQTEISWKGTSLEVKNALLLEFDAYNRAINDVLSLLNKK